MVASGPTRSVHVLCAPPNGFNPGMASVDLSFGPIAEAAGADEVVYWRLWDQSEWLSPVGGSHLLPSGDFFDEFTKITYRSARNHLADFLSADAVVFWGDFLHMASYLRMTADVLHRRVGLYDHEDDALGVAAEFLLLRGQPESVLAKSLSSGTTLLFNTAADYDSGYGETLEKFVRGVHRIWFRDTRSAEIGETMRSEPLDRFRGVDSAFLLEPQGAPPREDSLGVFFGRSAVAPEAVARLGRDLTKALALRPRWLPWGSQPALWPMRQRRRLRLAWPGLEHETPRVSMTQRLQTYQQTIRGHAIPESVLDMTSLLHLVASQGVTLTDTYHLAVNSWRLGTPAICVIDEASQTWSVNSGDPSVGHDKREALYEELGAQPLLVRVSELAADHHRVVDRLITYLRDPAWIGEVERRLKARSEATRQELIAELAGLLAGRPDRANGLGTSR